jgi:hypothetical protein
LVWLVIEHQKSNYKFISVGVVGVEMVVVVVEVVVGQGQKGVVAVALFQR